MAGLRAAIEADALPARVAEFQSERARMLE
jgi:hypothetical protein